jgi:predicted transcriptional regulator
MADVALAIRIPAELDEALSRRASASGKTKTRLVQEVLAEFVVSEEAFAAAILEGRQAADVGELLSHEEVMRRIDARLAERK